MHFSEQMWQEDCTGRLPAEGLRRLIIKKEPPSGGSFFMQNIGVGLQRRCGNAPRLLLEEKLSKISDF